MQAKFPEVNHTQFLTRLKKESKGDTVVLVKGRFKLAPSLKAKLLKGKSAGPKKTKATMKKSKRNQKKSKKQADKSSTGKGSKKSKKSTNKSNSKVANAKRGKKSTSA